LLFSYEDSYIQTGLPQRKMECLYQQFDLFHGDEEA